MSLIAKNESDGSSNFKPVDPGLHRAICYAVYDLGTHVNETFGKTQHKVMIAWELPDERIEVDKDGEKVDMPRVISKEYTMSLHEKANLRTDLEGWRGRSFTPEEEKGFDLTNVVGKPCQINVIHRKSKKNGNVYANIAAVMPAPKDKSMSGMRPENPQMWYDIEDAKIPDEIPKWIQDKIMASNEKRGIPHDVADDIADYRGDEGYNAFADDDPDDLPF